MDQSHQAAMDQQNKLHDVGMRGIDHAQQAQMKQADQSFAADQADKQAKAAKKGMWDGVTPAVRPTDAPRQAFGPAWVFDGNSMRVGGSLVFLAGIEAPELPQSCSLGAGQGAYFCGAYVRSVLIKLTMGKKIFCAIERRQGDDRNWATCAEANAAGTGPKDGVKSINEEMVRSGWAVADRRTSNAYLNAQIAADNENVGLWQGTFTAPREWRLGFR